MKSYNVRMIVYGLVVILVGLGVLIATDKIAELWLLGEIADYSKFFLAHTGAAGAWGVAAGGDQLRYVNWVKFGITKCILTVVVNLYAMAQSYVSFSKVGRRIITDIFFPGALLAFSLWRAKRGIA